MSYLDAVQEFIEAANGADDLVELGAIFEKAISDLGGIHFVCMSNVDPLRPPESAIVLGNYPEAWALHFSEQQYHRIDPIFNTAQSQLTPFEWPNERWLSYLSADQQKILNEASEIGLKCGLSIPIHCSEGFPASCTVVFDSNDYDPMIIHAIHIMSVYLHAAALSIKLSPTPFIKRILTTRQCQCLELVAQGKSDWAISKILGISESTVHFHIRAILKRLRVATRTQAIVKALFLGEIRFADIALEREDPEALVHIGSK